ncbi:MAG: hypothetical protein V1853_04045 [bacterium]
MFNKKSEFHITVLDSATGRKLIEAFQERPELENEFNRIISGLNWTDVTLKPEKYHITQDRKTEQLTDTEKNRLVKAGLLKNNSETVVLHREAIIQMVELPAF